MPGLRKEPAAFGKMIRILHATVGAKLFRGHLEVKAIPPEERAGPIGGLDESLRLAH
jgi:hypothetical protein